MHEVGVGGGSGSDGNRTGREDGPSKRQGLKDGFLYSLEIPAMKEE